MKPTSPLRRNAQLRIEYLDIAIPQPMPGAPRRHPNSQIRALAKSLQAFGQVLPILIDSENRIISGHAQLEAARKVGMTQVMVVRVEYLSEPQTKALMIALNRLADLSSWDDAALNTILLGLHELDLDFDIEATGFTEIEIELRLEQHDVDEPVEQAIVVGSGPAVTQPDDLWQLGEHQLLCGNALEEVAWARILGQERAAVVVTDPPYNVPIDGHVSGLGKHRHRGRCQSKCTLAAPVVQLVPADAQSQTTAQPVSLFQLLARGDPPGGDDVRALPAKPAER